MTRRAPRSSPAISLSFPQSASKSANMQIVQKLGLCSFSFNLF